jgi:hypothetical protein
MDFLDDTGHFSPPAAALEDESIPLAKLVDVAAGTDGLSAGALQVVLQALATRIQALEDAP